MDKAYKTLFLRRVKDLMKIRFNQFKPFKLEKENPLREVLSGGILYRKALPNDRFVWINWYPGPGVERYFNVYLEWSVGDESLPATGSHVPALLNVRAPLPEIVGGSLDLEQVEGKNAIGGITIPSPWDQLLFVKAAAPQSILRAVQLKAFAEAAALMENERQKAADQALDDVF